MKSENNTENMHHLEIKGGQFSWDTEKGGLFFYGIPSVLFWSNPSLLKMLEPLAVEIGYDLFRLMVAHSSSYGTEQDYKNVILAMSNDFREGFSAWGQAGTSIGWGKFNLVEFNFQEKKATVIVSNPWELHMQKDMVSESRWGCPFLQGKLIGIFSQAMEVTCWADEKITYDSDGECRVEFSIFKSNKTITEEIKQLRIKKMEESERKLTLEVEKQTIEIRNLLEEIKQKNEELTELNASLEEKVVERTKELNQKNIEIEAKNKHITSSIEYAQKIQDAILPDLDSFRANFQNYFIIYLPKDIVAGDFYWATHEDKYTFLVAADCTGHGVPGGFLSMIGSMLFAKIVNEDHNFDCTEILEKLDAGVKKALKQEELSEDSPEDGMELSIVRFEKNKNEIIFCGAHRPAYLVSAGKLTDVSGNKRSIGGRPRKTLNPFEQKLIQVQKGDMLYLTSDGFADQSNPEGKKIGTKNFKTFLEEIAPLDIDNQKEKLISFLKNHQNFEAQRDDILVVGIQL